MARITIASLQAQLVTAKAENDALRAQLSELSTKPRKPSAWRENARVLYVNGHPRVTYFKPSEAYKGMRAAQERGHRAVYLPA